MSGRGEPKAKRAKTGTYIPLNMPFQLLQKKDGKKFFFFFFFPFSLLPLSQLGSPSKVALAALRATNQHRWQSTAASCLQYLEHRPSYLQLFEFKRLSTYSSADLAAAAGGRCSGFGMGANINKMTMQQNSIAQCCICYLFQPFILQHSKKYFYPTNMIEFSSHSINK